MKRRLCPSSDDVEQILNVLAAARTTEYRLNHDAQKSGDEREAGLLQRDVDASHPTR